MQIIVQGKAEADYKPEQVVISLTFSGKEQEYAKVLTTGTDSVVKFMDEVLGKLKFTKEDMKTQSFRVSEEKKRVRKKNSEGSNHNIDRNYDDGYEFVFDGFSFRQEATVKFDYDLKRITQFIELVAALKNPPVYTMNFDMKEYSKRENDVIAEAYKAAEERAEAIAKAAGFNYVKNIKCDFEPIQNERIWSRGVFSSHDISLLRSAEAPLIARSISRTFTPEDIHISQTVYCLFAAVNDLKAETGVKE